MNLPLDGIRILDLSRLLPGPLCTQLLADMGAEVIKIEDHMGGDYSRWFPPKRNKQGINFFPLNRNKKSVKLDISKPEGKEIFLKMAKEADVILETFRPGAMERLGLGYEQVKEVNPSIIYCSLSGYGQDSPYRNLPGHDANYLSIAGVLSTIGTKDGKPVIPGIQIADIAGSYNAAVAILSAVYGKLKNGVGQYVDIALADSAILFQVLSMAQFMYDGVNPQMSNELLASKYAFYDVYQTKDGQYLVSGNFEEKFWLDFLKAIGKEELMKDMFAGEPRQTEVKQEIADVIKTKDRDEWINILKDYDVCTTPVNNYEQALKDPHIVSRGLWFEMDDPVEGKIAQFAYPAKFSTYRPGWRSSPPNIGENSEEIVKALGYTDEQIKELFQKNII